MRYRKTYGIDGLLEWHGIIECGGAKMKVDFTNGSVTAYGVAPASFTTENEMTQFFIENSKQFKGGRIRIVRSIELKYDKQEAAKVVTDIENVRKVVPDKKLRDVEEVENCSDARIWLKEHMNINVIGKSKKEIISIAADKGINFPNLPR